MLQDRRRLERQLRGRRRDLGRLLEQARSSAALLEPRRRNRPRPTYPEELPISARRQEILAAIRAHPVVIVAGETGSGKSTQLPKLCLEAGRGLEAKIAVTQPRRVAALSISQRIAEELGATWGREVGCKIRFTDRSAPQSYIKVVTDGMLLAETQNDPELLEYDTIIVDEAHERSLNIDFLLGYVRLLRRKRPELKVLITSATIDTETFSKAFDNAPVIEVSGRVYPVEVRYWPLDELLEDSGEYTYIDAATSAVDQVLAESRQGDVLVFMPSERDIRETCDKLQGRRHRGLEILPLFGRLSTGEQQRIFAPGPARRVVVSTNIAETSLTIPRIHYVIDTGLARLSRYNPRTHTRRLPIEPISQSSARQRQGRCGRVQNGVCIRLYSEADFLSRPPYTEPEIQRANLAEVILRMLSLHLGDVQTFPFIDPPRPQAIAGGFQLLRELGALDEGQKLTRLGRDMARLPIDPTVARMLLQAHAEKALEPVLVIAAAISIQDPRERPLDQQEAADQMHRQFLDRHSDFLTYLNIWNAYHDQLEATSQNQMRKFCKGHFLSYVRMREWRDIHAQLQETLGEIGDFPLEGGEAGYDAVHRSILTGLLSSIAHRQEGNMYRAARDREVMLFPGSGLFQRGERKGGEKPASGPEWIAAAEIVETSRLFARTAARIDPAWVAELGAHLCRSSYKEPYWNARSGRVLVREVLTLYGLEVLSRRIPYSRINAREATEIFIREALVPGAIGARYPFAEHNRRLCDKLEAWQTRLRPYQGLDVEEEACRFYAERLGEASSLPELDRLLRERGPEHLHMKEEDLLGARGDAFDAGAFPDALDLDGEKLPLSYAYRPGQEEDGITLRLPYKLVHAVDQEVLEWLVPGLLEEKITHLLRALPKSMRRTLVPIPEKARQIALELRPTHPTFLESLQEHIRQHYGLHIRAADWQIGELPAHLRMRVEVQGEDAQTVAAGRDLRQLVNTLEQPPEAPSGLEAWSRAAGQWEREGVRAWDFGDLPERLEVARVNGLPIYAYPGLEPGAEDGARIRLYKSRDEAEESSRRGLRRLGELVLAEEMTWLRRELKELNDLKQLYRPLGSMEQLRQQALEHLQRYAFERQQVFPLTQERFAKDLEQARHRLRGLTSRFLTLLYKLLEQRRQILLSGHAYEELEEDLERLLPADFLQKVPYEQLPQVQRYLQAVHLRAERAHLDARKDRQKAEQVRPYQEKLDAFLAFEGSPRRRTQVEELRWMLEEYRISVFAQELGTARPISPKRLDAQIARIEALP